MTLTEEKEWLDQKLAFLFSDNNIDNRLSVLTYAYFDTHNNGVISAMKWRAGFEPDSPRIKLFRRKFALKDDISRAIDVYEEIISLNEDDEL
ncbi:MAG: hypothetical protein RRY79_02295 [Clostridia bacterium]